MSDPRCIRCSEVLRERGGAPPRFCPRCGLRVTTEARRAATGEDREPCFLAYVAFFLSLVGVCVVRFPLFGVIPIVLGFTSIGRIANSVPRMTGAFFAKLAIALGILECLLYSLQRIA